MEIKTANNARKQLKRKNKKTYANPIKDDRLVKAGLSPYILFARERHASGDLRGMPISESGKLIGQEWKGLTAGEKEVSFPPVPTL